MSPGQQAIQVVDLRVQFVVSLRADRDNAMRANHPDVRRHVENAAVGNFLAVPHLHESQFILCRRIDKDGGDDQGTKIVPFAGLINTDSLNAGFFSGFGHRSVA